MPAGRVVGGGGIVGLVFLALRYGGCRGAGNHAVKAREVRNKIADYGCHCIVCENRGARVGLEAVDLEMQMQMQMAMQRLSEFGRRGARMRLRRVRQGRKGREERKRSIKTDDRQLKAQDKSLKISTKENRGVGSR